MFARRTIHHQTAIKVAYAFMSIAMQPFTKQSLKISPHILLRARLIYVYVPPTISSAPPRSFYN